MPDALTVPGSGQCVGRDRSLMELFTDHKETGATTRNPSQQAGDGLRGDRGVQWRNQPNETEGVRRGHHSHPLASSRRHDAA